jgi:hypothetical protein
MKAREAFEVTVCDLKWRNGQLEVAIDTSAWAPSGEKSMAIGDEDFDERCDAALKHSRATGESYSTEEALAELRQRTEARRAELAATAAMCETDLARRSAAVDGLRQLCSDTPPVTRGEGISDELRRLRATGDSIG